MTRSLPSPFVSLVRVLAGIVLLTSVGLAQSPKADSKTVVSIVGDAFQINGKPTYEGREWNGHKVEGLLLNSRMVQGIFDDLNPETRDRWAYPDTGTWDADRNTDEFVAAMPEWREHGLLCVVLNLQGGSPEGYSQGQPWHNSAINADGTLRPDYLNRLDKIITRADDLGMVVMLGIFYFGQDERLEGDDAARQAVANTVAWIAKQGYQNVLLEIANESNNGAYQIPIIKSDRVHELVELAQTHAKKRDLDLPVSVSFNGGTMPTDKVIQMADYVLLHGNGVKDPARMKRIIDQVRSTEGYTPKPIVNNEDDRPWRDDHQGFGETGNNFVVCVENYASWGYFDFRERGEGFDEGYQSVPVNWGISSERKRAFFDLLAKITGSKQK